MLSYYLKQKKDTQSKNPKVESTNKGKSMSLSKCAVSGIKNLRFIKGQKAKGLLGVIIKIPLTGPLLI